jgi:hypothetical protein
MNFIWVGVVEDKRRIAVYFLGAWHDGAKERVLMVFIFWLGI